MLLMYPCIDGDTFVSAPTTSAQAGMQFVVEISLLFTDDMQQSVIPFSDVLKEGHGLKDEQRQRRNGEMAHADDNNKHGRAWI